MSSDRISAVNLYSGNQNIFVCEQAVRKIEADFQQKLETSNGADEEDGGGGDDDANVLHTSVEPQPLTIMKARKLVSWYTLSQNPSMSAVESSPALHPLWVRCDMSDPAGTTWLGAETVRVTNKITGMKLYSITCKGSTADKESLMTIEDLKQEHKKRHHSSSVGIKGCARFNLFGSTVVENTTIESHSSVTVDFKWSHVESILEIPPLSSTATLNIKIASGDMRSPMFEMYKELEFLQTLAEGLRTGETEWMESPESMSAVSLINVYSGDENKLSNTPIFNSFLERGDLDFVEQLWVRMRNSVTSYQDIGECLKLVTEALRHSDIKPWIHRDSSSSLSTLIRQSYHQQMDSVSLTGVTPVNMLLEMGLDKMRKDYINYLLGEGLTTLNHLCFYLSTEVDLQEQVIRLTKLHHLLEIVVNCSTYLALPYDRLFLLTQSCLQHYKTSPYDEEYEFKLQIKPALISHFYQKEHPVLWGIEVSSGHGPREVRTSLQLSDTPLVDHVVFETGKLVYFLEKCLVLCCSFHTL
uniref:Protein zwilch n=1 Tax=Gouania willdenowi TaxID=441366 RepID=A0A8C5DQY7_GOUWI